MFNGRDSYTGLIRNPERVLANLKVTDTDQLVTLKECKIQVPVRYKDKNLVEIGINTSVYGIYALIMENEYYSVSSVPANISIDPYKVITEKVKGVPYYSFYFEADSVVIKNLNIIKQDTLLFNIIDEFFFKGKIPWYLTPEDLGKIFDKAHEYAGADVASRYEVIELMTSVISRQKNDRVNFYKNLAGSINDLNYLLTNPTDYVPLNSVYYLSDTYNKLAGNHLDHGIISALVLPSDHMDHVEELLRT